MLLDGLMASVHILAGAFLADVHKELLVVGDVKQIKVVVCGVDGQNLLITKVIEGLDQSSTALTGAYPGVTGGTLCCVLNTRFLLDIGLVLFKVQCRYNPGFGLGFAVRSCLSSVFCGCLCAFAFCTGSFGTCHF
jgi:hypothetical protein